MKILSNKFFPVMAGTLAVLFAGTVYAQSNIEFPITELGDCSSKEECKAYCDEEANFRACRSFASEHNLGRGNHDKKFEVVAEDGGPGGCAEGSEDAMESCERYCNIAVNMKTCVTYAKEHDLMKGEELEEAEKVLRALESGAKLPSGCENKESCHRVCEEPADVSIARECFAFAEAAGLLPPGVSRDQAERMFKAIEEGRAPFKSPKEFEKCEDPQSDEIMEKCVNFAIESGFITGEEAEMVKKTRGKGPGGCRGKTECEAYCEAHQDECFAFAEEHNLVPQEDRARMKEEMERMRRGGHFESDRPEGMMFEGEEGEGLPAFGGAKGDQGPRGMMFEGRAGSPGEGPRGTMRSPAKTLEERKTFEERFRMPPEGEFRMPPEGMGEGEMPYRIEGGLPTPVPPEGYLTPPNFTVPTERGFTAPTGETR